MVKTNTGGRLVTGDGVGGLLGISDGPGGRLVTGEGGGLLDTWAGVGLAPREKNC